MQGRGNLIVGLDIGTTKICCVVGELLHGEVNIIGIGTHPSRGLKKGVVVDIESTVQSIQRAVEEAELMAGCEIHSVHVGIAGSQFGADRVDGDFVLLFDLGTVSDTKSAEDAKRG